MSESTYTRKELRRAIGLELQMPFYRRYPAGERTISDTTSTVSRVVDTGLNQSDGYWNGAWYFSLTNSDVSVVRSFQNASKTFDLETPRTAATEGEKYEFLAVYSPTEVHAAINRAIQSAAYVFPKTVDDTSLIVQEDKLSYTISSLTSKPWKLSKVYVENAKSITRGTATAGGASTITVQSVPSDITTNWKISIYAGTGAGQIKNYASAVGNVITVNTAWSTNPDSTSKYAIWDATAEWYDWDQVFTVYVDAKEYPDTLRFRYLLTGSYGMRIRIEYLSQPTDLSADSDTTTVPKEYIILKACSLLHGSALANNKADRDLHFAEHKRYSDAAEQFMYRQGWRVPDVQIGVIGEEANYVQFDPLGWL